MLPARPLRASAPVLLGRREAHRLAAAADPLLRECRALIALMARRADADRARALAELARWKAQRRGAA